MEHNKTMYNIYSIVEIIKIVIIKGNTYKLCLILFFALMKDTFIIDYNKNIYICYITYDYIRCKHHLIYN